MSTHHMMVFHHKICALPIKWLMVNDGCLSYDASPSYDGHSSYNKCPFPFFLVRGTEGHGGGLRGPEGG